MLSKLTDLINGLHDALVYNGGEISELRRALLVAMTALRKLHDSECERQYTAPPMPAYKNTPVRCVRLLRGDDSPVDLFFVGNTVSPSKIMAIKQLRSEGGLGLKEAKDVLDAAQDTASAIGPSGICTI